MRDGVNKAFKISGKLANQRCFLVVGNTLKRKAVFLPELRKRNGQTNDCLIPVKNAAALWMLFALLLLLHWERQRYWY